MKAYKILPATGIEPYSNSKDVHWKLPEGETPGRWMPRRIQGYALCREEDLVWRLNNTIYEAEYTGKMVVGDKKIVVRRTRLIHKLEKWNDGTAALFAADCIEHVLSVYEDHFPEDNRPHIAIEVARRFGCVEIGGMNFAAGTAAAWAVGVAARNAANVALATAWIPNALTMETDVGIVAAKAVQVTERAGQTTKLMEYLA